MWKGFIKDYLTFSRKDRIAILVLIGIFISVIVMPKFMIPIKPSETKDSSTVTKEILSLISDSGIVQDTYNRFTPNEQASQSVHTFSGNLFVFDPNSITIEEWERLGVKKNVASSIKKYLSKGGQFRKPEDLFKIYTLDKTIAAKLIPYVRIKESESGLRNNEIRSDPASENNIKEKKETSYHPKQYTEIEINTADTTQFMLLPGIGKWRANSIVRYRESLGGFVSVNQLREVKALPDSVLQKVLQYLKIETGTIRKININTATTEELLRHPYFTTSIVNSLIQYRNQHGNFKSIADLQNLHIMSNDLYDRIRYYLVL